MSVLRIRPGGEPIEPLTELDRRIGRNLQSLRRARGYSPRELAAMISRSHKQLLLMEAGRQRIRAVELFKLAHLLNISVASLFFGKGNNARLASSDVIRKFGLAGAQSESARQNE